MISDACENILGRYVMDNDVSFDIDTELDFEMAELYLLKFLGNRI